MKKLYSLLLMALFGSQLFGIEGLEKRPVGRPRTKQVVQLDPFASKRKAGRPGKPGCKFDTRLTVYSECNTKPMVPSGDKHLPQAIKQAMPSSFTAVKTLGFGARFLRGGLVGTVLGYVGENVYSILADNEKRDAIKNAFFPKNASHQEDSANNTIDQNKLPVMPHVAFYNRPLVKGSVGAVCIAGLGYAAYKMYKKVHEKYVKKNNTLNKVTE